MITIDGGMSDDTKAATDEIQQLVDEVQEEITSQSGGKQFAQLKAISYKSQLVAGTNYFVKVHTGDDEHIHVKIFKTLPVYGNTSKLTAIQHDKKAYDSITFF